MGLKAAAAFPPSRGATNFDEPPLTGDYRFYRSSGDTAPGRVLPQPYSASLWSPSLRSFWPAGVPDSRIKLRFLFRAALHYLGLFANHEDGAVCVHLDRQLVHYSLFTPRYWRFPFLSDDDIQIGDTWTDPSHRGKGLAAFALAKVLESKRKPGRQFWYVVEAVNAPSIHVAERAGFEMVAVGGWQKPLGIKLLGSYAPRVAIVTRR